MDREIELIKCNFQKIFILDSKGKLGNGKLTISKRMMYCGLSSLQYWPCKFKMIKVTNALNYML